MCKKVWLQLEWFRIKNEVGARMTAITPLAFPCPCHHLNIMELTSNKSFHDAQKLAILTGGVDFLYLK